MEQEEIIHTNQNRFTLNQSYMFHHIQNIHIQVLVKVSMNSHLIYYKMVI